MPHVMGSVKPAVRLCPYVSESAHGSLSSCLLQRPGCRTGQPGVHLAVGPLEERPGTVKAKPLDVAYRLTSCSLSSLAKSPAMGARSPIRSPSSDGTMRTAPNALGSASFWCQCPPWEKRPSSGIHLHKDHCIPCLETGACPPSHTHH